MIIATGYDMSNPNTLYRLRTNSASPVYNNTDSNRNILQRDRVVYNSAFIRRTSSQYLMMILLDAGDTIYWEQSTNGGSSWSTAVSDSINTKGNGNIYGQSTPALIDGYVYTDFALNNWAEEIVTDLPIFTSIEDYNTYITNVYVPEITSGGAGSGYIGNALVSNKKMVGYNVPTSSATGTKTESVEVFDSNYVANKPKAGNGHVRIKFLRDSN